MTRITRREGLLAGLFGWKPRPFFDADPDAATPPPSLADAIGGPPPP